VPILKKIEVTDENLRKTGMVQVIMWTEDETGHEKQTPYIRYSFKDGQVFCFLTGLNAMGRMCFAPCDRNGNPIFPD
jgi:hypothetical protein